MSEPHLIIVDFAAGFRYYVGRLPEAEDGEDPILVDVCDVFQIVKPDGTVNFSLLKIGKLTTLQDVSYVLFELSRDSPLYQGYLANMSGLKLPRIDS